MKILGIDPGNRGGIALIHNDNIQVYPTPTEEILVNKRRKTFLNLQEIAELIRKLSPNLCYMEKVTAMPNQGVTSMFNFGMGYGALQGILTALNVPTTLIRPQEWKRHLLEYDTDKDASIDRCKELFPAISLRRSKRSRKDCDGLAEALLIAYYGLLQEDGL